MLHVHSYNMGVAAGIAWQAAGKDHFYVGDLGPNREDTPEYKFIDTILNKTDKLDMFMPSSFLEGFYNAFNNPYFINA